MEPVWYYAKADADGEYFVVYADANNSSSRRRFMANDGSFVDEAKGGLGSSFSQAFKADVRSSYRLGALNGRPNLVDAVKARRLPNDVLSELQRLKKSLVG